MSLIEGFTRPEVIRLTLLSSERLAYFDRIGLIVPVKYGSSKKPTCLYSWEQLLELIAIKDLLKKISIQTIKKVLENLGQIGVSEHLRTKHLVVVGNDVFWVEDDWKDFPQKILWVSNSSRSVCNYVLAFMITADDLINTLWDNARNLSEVEFKLFKERAKSQPKTEAA